MAGNLHAELCMDALSDDEWGNGDALNHPGLSQEDFSSESDCENDEDKEIISSKWQSNLFQKRRESAKCNHPITEFNYGDLTPQSTKLDHVQHFLDTNIVADWVKETNRYVAQVKTLKPSSFKDWADVTVNDFWVFIGLSTLMGVDQKPALKDYWSRMRLLYSPIYGETMSRDRYLQILSAFHLIDNDSYDPKNESRLIKLGNFLPSVMNAFKTTITPGEYICADESLLAFKGRLSFKQYIPSKRSRFGIKFFVLVDCESKYVIKMIPYTGKNTSISQKLITEYGYGGAVILTLTEDYLDKNRIVVMDNYFTSPMLAQQLKHRQTNLLGTVRKHRKGMPSMSSKMEKGGVEFYTQQEMTIVRWNDKREVLTLDTFINHGMEESNSKLKNGDWKLKPISVLRYNESMGGVDDVDRQLAPYAPERKTLKWYQF